MPALHHHGIAGGEHLRACLHHASCLGDTIQ